MRRFLLIIGVIAPILVVLYLLVIPRITDAPIRHESIELLTRSKQLNLAITQYKLDQQTINPNTPPAPPTVGILLKEGYLDRSFFKATETNKELFFVYFSPGMKPEDTLIEAFSDKGVVEVKAGGDGSTFPWKTYERNK